MAPLLSSYRSAAALGYATSVLHVYSLGAFIGPLQQEFGWSRAQTSAGLTVSALISAIGCIRVGMLVDRTGPRQVRLDRWRTRCAQHLRS